MQNIIKQLQIMKHNAAAAALKAQKSLKSAPATGRLRIVKKPARGKEQFYLVTNKEHANGRYLSRKKNLAVIQAYLQQEYDQQIIAISRQLITAIDSFLQAVPHQPLSQLYDTEPWRRNLITPHILSDAEFAAQWQSVSYSGRPFLPDTPHLYTARGERVRSKSEVIIADTLYRLGIPYRYEYPLKLKSLPATSYETASARTTRTIFPDFTILDVTGRRELILEHFGRMDEPDYAATVAQKLSTYAENGIFASPGGTLLFTMETKDAPLNVTHLENLLKTALDQTC